MLRILAKQTAVYGISSVVARLLNYLLTPYLTRIMTTAEYGVITDMYALIPFALVVLTLGLETGYFRFAARMPEQKSRVFATTWGAVSYLAMVFFALALLFRMPIARTMGYAQQPWLIVLAAGIVMLDVIAAIPFVRLREQGRSARFVSVRMVSVGINLALCFFFYGALPHIEALDAIWNPAFGAGYYMVANLVASAVVLVFVIPKPGNREQEAGGRGKILKKMLFYSAPLWISGIAGTAGEFIDRQLLKFLLPEGDPMAALGIYGAVLKIAVVMTLFTQMYRLAAEPFFLADLDKKDFAGLNGRAMKYFMIVSVGIFLLITLFADLFALIIGRDFREGIHILPVVLIGNILNGVVLNLSFWYKQDGRTRFAILITGVGLLFTIAMGWLLIPRLGYYGAALARLICEVAMVVTSYVLCRRFFPVPYQLRRIGEYVAIGAGLYFVGTAIHIYIVSALLLLAFGLYAIWREKIRPWKLR